MIDIIRQLSLPNRPALYMSILQRYDLKISNNFRILDLSFNRIKEITGLDNLLNLKKLFLSSNKIGEIKNVDHFPKLELLELGDNRIRVRKNLCFLIFKCICGTFSDHQW